MSAISTWHPSSGRTVGEVALPIPIPARRGRWTVLSVGLVVVLAAGWWVTNSPIFDLHRLEVRGTAHLTPGAVARLSGLTERSNVLWLATGPVIRRLEANPWIVSAGVTRELPSGVAITIRERIPVAVTAGPRPMLVAADGVVLGLAPAEAQLPRVGIPRSWRPGERFPAGAALAVAASFPPFLRPLIERVGEERGGLLVVRMRDGVRVVYGDASAAPAKSAALQAVLSWAVRNGVRAGTVDVVAPSAPAISQAGG
jgi:cell division protein FtsQ